MTCIRCQLDALTSAKVDALAEILKTKAHLIPELGLTEDEVFEAGLFRGAIERIRGQFAASMSEKRQFAALVLNRLQDDGLIKDWTSAGSSNRFDYSITMPTDRIAVVELKGCLDGNNTNIFERPTSAEEFYIWSVCQNAAANPNKNAWSGIHTRLGAEIIDKQKLVDGLIIWDMICGTIGRPCPKLKDDASRSTALAQYTVPPPCVYLFPRTIASPRNNPTPPLHTLPELQFLSALHTAFKGNAADVYTVQYEARNAGSDLQRRTRVSNSIGVGRESRWTSIRRS